MEMSAKKSSMQAKPMAELLPSLSGLLSKDVLVTLTAKKQPRNTTAQTRTNEKIFKPMTLAEMRAELQVLNSKSPRRANQPQPSAKKRGWNSSVKVEKKLVSHTADGQFKNNPVRKVLNFKPKPKPIPNPRVTIQNMETPKFPMPEYRAKKSLYHLKAQNSVRISGINNIPPTPVTAKPAMPRGRMTLADKENIPKPANVMKKSLVPPSPKLKKLPTPKPQLVDTPLLNSSWKSGSDASFLLKEKEINDVEEKVQAIVEEATLENIAEVSPPVSTPFKEYRSVQEYFNHSSCLENSALYNDNTIMYFDKPSVCHDRNSDIKEESVIVSLCDLLNKATVTNVEKPTTELDDLLEVEKQTEKNIKMLDHGIKMLTNVKESQIKCLKNVKKLIEEKRNTRKICEIDKDKTLEAETKNTIDVNKTLSPDKSPIVSRPCSVIKSSGSPSYKIPKRNGCLRKKVVCKSMPNVSMGMQTPVKGFEGRAFNMYMEMKEKMNFLSTPMVNREVGIPDTPALTSHNLQKQLDKLFGS